MTYTPSPLDRIDVRNFDFQDPRTTDWKGMTVDPDRYDLGPAAPAKPDPAKLLVVLACYLDAMRSLAHLIHLNYTGADFISVHNFLKDRYEEHTEQFDTVAELARIHHAMMPSTLAELRTPMSIFEDDACLCAYLKNLGTLIELATNLERVTRDCDCIDIANTMADLVAQAGKAAWFVRMTLGEDAVTM